MLKYFIIAFMLMSSQAQAKVIYFIPIPGHPHENMFYDVNSTRDEAVKAFCQLREHLEQLGHEVRYTYNGAVSGDVDVVISLCAISNTVLRHLSRVPRKKCWLINFEPPVTSPEYYEKSLKKTFGKIFTMFDDDVDNITYFKFFYPQPRMEMIENIPDFSQKKLCTLISGNKNSPHPKCIYHYRRSIISFFDNQPPGEFDLYGYCNIGEHNCKGPITSKWETLKNYKFSFCYENMGNQNGYITEKIFDSFIGGCVPIYLGADNITDYVPSDCFIDRRKFSSDNELYHYLKNINKETYDGYLNSIWKYLSSPQSHLYSIDNFIKIIVDNINEL